MTKTAKPGVKSPPEKSLRAAFKVIEAQPTPEALKEHVDRLTGEPPKPPRRS